MSGGAPQDFRIVTAHQSGQQIWAGLTSVIIEATKPILFPTDTQREHYWFVRNLNRVDHHVLRRTLQRRTLSPVLGIALVTVALPLIVSLVESGKKLSIFGHFISAATLALVLPVMVLLAGSIHTFIRYWRGLAAGYLPAELFRGPVGDVSFVDENSSSHPDPLHHAARGSLYLHQHDVKFVLNDIAAKGYDLVVFIDDLDRCAAHTTAEVFEAINLFLSSLNSDGLSARFVIGIDPSVIVAHLDQVYSGLNVARVARQGDDPSIGWTYLRKLVQLPVVIPKLSKEAMNAFIGTAAGLPTRRETSAPTQSGEATASPKSSQSQLQPAYREVSLLPITGSLSRTEAVIQNYEANQLIPWRSMEQHPLVVELMQERLAAHADGSIREAKRLINVWQLYARILTGTRPLDEPASEITRACTLVLLAEIIVRWPSLQHCLLRRFGEQMGLSLLADSAGEEDSWTITLRQIGAGSDDNHAALVNLRQLLREHDGKAIARLAEVLL